MWPGCGQDEFQLTFSTTAVWPVLENPVSKLPCRSSTVEPPIAVEDVSFAKLPYWMVLLESTNLINRSKDIVDGSDDKRFKESR